MDKSRSAKTKPVPIRVDSSTRERLGKAANRLASTRAGVIRLAIAQFLPEVESGQITLRK